MLEINVVGDDNLSRSQCPLTHKDCYGECMWAVINTGNGVTVCAIAIIALNLVDK